MKTGTISQSKISQSGNAYVLYDADIIAEPSPQLFDAFYHTGDYHTNNETRQNNSAAKTGPEKTGPEKIGIGRARVVYFSLNNLALVLKHYYRGGAVASILKDRYFGVNVENSRAFKEWRLLKKMFHLGLPVPRAVAAHVEKSVISYRADLITEEIKDAKTLADILGDKPVAAEQWKKIGACISSFHQHDVYHADLNARNILLAAASVNSAPEAGDVYLIDFDNSYIRLNADAWKMANLARLKRSLLKFKRNSEGFNFTEQNWADLLAGYKSNP